MEMRVFGRTGMQLSVLGFGCGAVGGLMVRGDPSDQRSTNTVARPPAPIRPKPTAVPANDRFRPHNRNRAQDGGKPVIKPNKQKTIGIVEMRTLRCPPAKHIDLLS